MVEDLVNDRTSLFGLGRPVVGSGIVFVLFKLVLVFLFIVVRDLGCAPCRKADLGLGRRQVACSYGGLALTLLLGGHVATGANVSIRLRVGAS
jgi:hypothetical protein